MKMIRTLIPILLLIVLLYGCAAGEKTPPTEIPPPSAAVGEPSQEMEEPVQEETIPVRESVEETEPASDTGATEPDPTGTGSQADSKEPDVTVPPKTEPAKPQNPPSAPPATQPPSVRSVNPDPKPTDPPQKETQPPENQPPATQPPAAEPPKVPPETTPPETEPPATEPEPTAPAVTEVTYEFKRQVAASAAKYINQYRASAGLPKCTVLPVMTLVAEYRADQLCWNYSHDTADKREALAHYKYGRWIDATQFGGDPSKSYYEADTSEAICAGFRGTDPEAMGRRIADMIRGSGTHWSYIGSAENIYIGVGVEYRAGIQYEWYGCVMVGPTNYG